MAGVVARKIQSLSNTYRVGMLFFLFSGYLREACFYIIFNSMETATYNIRIAPDIKTKAEEAFSALGLDMNEAIDTFLREVITGYGLPCEMREKVPNAETQAALDECEAMVRGEIPWPPTQTVAEILAELEKELEEELSEQVSHPPT